MHPPTTSVQTILKTAPIESSAPCRIDSGGTWDIKAMALPLEKIEPVTVNMALTLRTAVRLSPFKEGWVKIISEGFSEGEEQPFERLSFHSDFGVFFAAVSYFGFHGLRVDIRSGSPVKSALGGSSTALVALLKALSKLNKLSGGRSLSGSDILHLGYHLEDGVSGGNCGIQDQAAAAYGGVNKWVWNYGKRALLRRKALLDAKGMKEISKRILVAYSGKSHISAGINRSYVEGFLTGKTRAGWIEANHVVKEIARAIEQQDWNRAVDLLREEMAIRKKITPDALIPVTARLIEEAEKQGCGARFTGAGAGGSVWALGEPHRLIKLRAAWEGTLSRIKGAGILECRIDPVGVI